MGQRGPSVCQLLATLQKQQLLRQPVASQQQYQMQHQGVRMLQGQHQQQQQEVAEVSMRHPHPHPCHLQAPLQS